MPKTSRKLWESCGKVVEFRDSVMPISPLLHVWQGAYVLGQFLGVVLLLKALVLGRNNGLKFYEVIANRIRNL
jgi:hypothetical protein